MTFCYNCSRAYLEGVKNIVTKMLEVLEDGISIVYESQASEDFDF
jgi:hypothetical protein